MKKINIPVIILAFLVTFYLVSIDYTVIVAQQNDQCPVGQIPVYEGDKMLINKTTNEPVCKAIGPIDPLGNIFGR